jgi:hypothetical protein
LVPVIIALHDMAAGLLGEPMRVAEVDARKLAEAYCNWRRFYPPVVASRTMALGSLLLVAGVIEIPRLKICALQRKLAAQQAVAAQRAAAHAAGKVVTMPPGGLAGV